MYGVSARGERACIEERGDVVSDIQWTEETWNPVRGCKPVSPGCAHCYAEPLTARLEAMGHQGYAGLTKIGTGPKRRVWTGEFREVPEMLDVPLRKRKPTTWFVNSMSDLFGEGVSNEFISAVFGVMAATPLHTYQALTKRAERLPEWVAWVAKRIVDGRRMFPHDDDGWMARQLFRSSVCRYPVRDVPQNHGGAWPLPNVWLGVSVEDRKHGLLRIEHLRRTPAAVRFLSIEPLLEDLGQIDLTDIHWVIVGGESGPGARPFDLAWARSIRDQCKAAGVPFFFKQAGAMPRVEDARAPTPEEIAAHEKRRMHQPPRMRGTLSSIETFLKVKDKKGGDPAEWPEDLRIREYPRAYRAGAP